VRRLFILGPVVLALALAGCGSPAATTSAPGSPGAGSVGGTAASSTPASAPTTTPASSGVVPSAGTSLASVSGGGRLNVVANAQGQGFDVIDSVLGDSYDDESTLRAYAADGTALAVLPAGSFTGECGAADVINRQGRLLITEQIKTAPAQGINPATYSLVLTGWNATSGDRVWTATPISSSTDSMSCGAFDGNLQDFSATLDGTWGVLLWPLPDSDVSDAIDLTNGRLYPHADLQGTLGNYVVTGVYHTPDGDGPNHGTLTLPGSWPRLGSFTVGSDRPDDVPLDEPGIFAPTGELANQGYSSPPVVQTSPDGTELIGIGGDISDDVPLTVNAYALPSTRLRWSVKTPQYSTDTLEAVNASVVVIGREKNDGDGTTTLIALDLRTGATVWRTNIGAGSLCDLTSSQVLVNTNDQLATLSARTGKQLSYESDPYQDDTGGDSCPGTVADGITGVGYANGQVTQILKP
jgi:hypothetical protein